MPNKERQAETKVDSEQMPIVGSSAQMPQNPMLSAALSAVESNKLIADFMGVQLGKELYSWRIGCTEPLKEQHLNYHSSWGWLMPVIEKIENTWIGGAKSICKIEGDKVQIYHTVGYMNTDFATNYGYNGEKYDKITKAYLSVVDFVKWYNQQGVSEGSR